MGKKGYFIRIFRKENESMKHSLNFKYNSVADSARRKGETEMEREGRMYAHQ